MWKFTLWGVFCFVFFLSEALIKPCKILRLTIIWTLRILASTLHSFSSAFSLNFKRAFWAPCSTNLWRKAHIRDRARSWSLLAEPTEKVRIRVSLRMARQGANRGPLAQACWKLHPGPCFHDCQISYTEAGGSCNALHCFYPEVIHLFDSWLLLAKVSFLAKASLKEGVEGGFNQDPKEGEREHPWLAHNHET